MYIVLKKQKMYHTSLQGAGKCGTFSSYLIFSDYQQTFQNVRAFAKISDDHGKGQ